ncbi:hypothetical protein BDV41DRAFT_542648 [Aspergillus transmontanensis]|uniref:Uncharacterized protein n=1 Tax=Aspergillus transmontanensis TaxID=1034304 RepID=A0A5N6VRS0_9EURO|nr:hypothetical protein BDV41DRAFT_542648 [Aspergillus transmontanensis]
MSRSTPLGHCPRDFPAATIFYLYPEVSIHSYTSVFIYSWLSFLLLHLHRLC